MSAEIPEVGLPHLGSGKVRESYELDEARLVFVTTDRISAFDVVMNELIPNKGRVLSATTSFWFDELEALKIPNHEAQFSPSELPDSLDHPYYLGRTAIVRRAKMLPIECIVRGHLTGSAWKEYKQTGTVHKMPAPADMVESEAFPEPIFTPSTKAETGHDENISFDEAVDLIGGESAEQVRDMSLRIFKRMYRIATESGLVLADTKLEFGTVGDTIILGDEVGTGDSSRYWSADSFEPGRPQPSFDKQYLRDHLEVLYGAGDWNKQPPPPELPNEVVKATAQKYQEGFERLSGQNLSDWPGEHLVD